MKDRDNRIFALDIGTRKVVGIIAQKVKDKIKVIDVEIAEHTSRTMLDGQIHNVNEVAKIVINIKQTLEKRQGLTLNKVGVAVAGRALKTVKTRIEKEISLDVEINDDNVKNLELEAVSNVLDDVNNDLGKDNYYCVGYSVVKYELDGGVIGDLIGHFGRNVAVDVIATFLPRVVFDSMLSVLRRAELEITNLTLEPIAAINVIIPKDVRRLNLLLLDIGAGTSDVALTKEGTVFAYGMVPEAGDEITEMICEKFILDFGTAEAIKRVLMQRPKIQFRDILGKEHHIETAKVIESIRLRVKALAHSISSYVLELNQKVPHAVILIGGGSLTPLFESELSAAFPLDASNIGVRLPEFIEGIEDKTGKLKGPDMVTPLGICVMTANSSGLKFIELSVNDRRVNVLDMQQNLDVLSALISAGIDKMRLYGKIGQAICVEVNGQFRVIKGEMGKPAQILINGEKAALNTRIKNQDKITFLEAENGKDAEAEVKDILEITTVKAIVNGNEVEINPQILMNDFPVSLDTPLPDRANIEYHPYVQVSDALEACDIDTQALAEREIMVRVNKEPKILSQASFSLFIGGNKASLSSKVTEGSILEFKPDQAAFYKIKDVVEMPPSAEDTKVILNGEMHIIPGAPGRIFMNDKAVDPEEFIIDRAEIVTKSGGKLPPTVSQILEHLPFNSDEQRGKLLKITVDGTPAGFTTQLVSGAEVVISFEERS